MPYINFAENALYHEFLAGKLDENFKLQSRIHNLKTFGENVFVKRDDELSSGITGSKMRKFASLLPWLRENNFDEVVLIGSAQSNNIVGLLQLLIENNIPPKLFLLESNETDLKGNLLWANLLYDFQFVTWIKRADWPDVETIAENYKTQCFQQSGKRIFIVLEGAANVQSLPGAMSLTADILHYEAERNIFFSNIFIDSGSGLTAMGLLHGFALANSEKRNIHITLIAGNEADFQKQYASVSQEASCIYGFPEKCFRGKLAFHRAAIAPSFGSITRQVLDEVKILARHEGILAEPVYTAKHFATARKIIAAENLQANALIINSGGSFGLSGFQEKLKA